MGIQLPVDGAGTRLDTDTIARAAGSGLAGDRQAVVVYDRGAPGGHIASRYPSGRLLFAEMGKGPMPGMWNDALGGATSDAEIMLGDLPTFRLDTQGQTFTANTVGAPTSPSATAGAGGGSFAGGTTYGYKITSHNLVGESVGGTEVTATPAAGGHVDLAWTKANGAAYQNIYRTPTAGSGWLFLASSANFGSTYTDTGTITPSGAIPVAQTTSCPGRTATTGGVVFKRRIEDGYTGKFGVECWFRLTSNNNTSTSYPILALYNRDGTSAYHGRVWLNPMGNNQPMHGWILDGAASNSANSTGPAGSGAVWRDVITSNLQNGGGTHTYSLAAGSLDRAGGWHTAKLIVDMVAKTYVGVYLDGAYTDLTAYSLDTTTTSGAAMMHFSFEYGASTPTRPRFMHVARVIGTEER